MSSPQRITQKRSLHELQTRLADRLLAARGDGLPNMQWLAVQAGGRNYLLPLSQAGEIFPWTQVQAVPYAQAWFLGVASLRGNLLGVIDLCAFLGHSVQRTGIALSETSLLAINPALQVNAALVVDQLLGLRSAESLQLSQAASPEHSLLGLGGLWTDAQGQQWQELSLQTMVQTPAFLRVGL